MNLNYLIQFVQVLSSQPEEISDNSSDKSIPIILDNDGYYESTRIYKEFLVNFSNLNNLIRMMINPKGKITQNLKLILDTKPTHDFISTCEILTKDQLNIRPDTKDEKIILTLGFIYFSKIFRTDSLQRHLEEKIREANSGMYKIKSLKYQFEETPNSCLDTYCCNLQELIDKLKIFRLILTKFIYECGYIFDDLDYKNYDENDFLVVFTNFKEQAKQLLDFIDRLSRNLPSWFVR